MEVTFQLMPADLRAFQRLYWKRQPAKRISNALFTGVCVGMGCFGLDSIINASTIGQPTSPYFPMAQICVPFVFVFLLLAFLSWNARSQRKTSPALVYPQTIQISPEGVSISERYSETQRRWPGIIAIESDKTLICFYIAQNSAHLIPRRAFPDPQTAQRFEDTARAYWKGLPAPPPELSADQWPPPPQRLTT